MPRRENTGSGDKPAVVRTRQQIGASSNRRGKVAEQAVARYFREAGFPPEQARRAVITGSRDHADGGDIQVEGVTVEVKHWSGGLSEQQIVAFIEKLTNVQKRAGDIGLLVERRDGLSDKHLVQIGRWWCHLVAADYLRLVGGSPVSTLDPLGHTVRIQLRDAVRLLRYAGYGIAPANPFQAVHDA